jgi:hypothetical protein
MPRQSGKTTFLMSWLMLDPNHMLVVHSGSEADRLKKLYGFRKIDNQIVSIDYVMSGRLRGKKDAVIAIDNLDLILPQILGTWGNQIGPITYTGDFTYGN